MRTMEMAFIINATMTGNMNSYASQTRQTLNQLGIEATRLQTRYASLQSALATANSRMAAAQSAIATARREYAAGTISSAQYTRTLRDMGDEFTRASAEASRLSTEIRSVSEAQAGNARARISNGISAIGGGFSTAMGSIQSAVMTAQELAGPLISATQSAMKFESAMADVKKVVDFDTPTQFKELSDDVLKLTSVLPMTADEIARIVAAGGQAGIASNELLAFAESAAKMGVAFDITADQAGDMMAQWRTAFAMGQSEVTELADKINYLGNTTSASADKIADVITRIGPLGDVGGIASGEIAALGASMIGVGITSDVASTGIKNLMLGLVAGESATSTQKNAFAKLGLSATDMAQRMQVDAKGAILDVLTAIQGLDKAEQASTLKNLFGAESLGAIAPLLSNLDNLKENFEKVGDATQYAGSMEKEYQARSETTENQMKLFQNTLERIAINIGSAILPALSSMAESLSGVATSIAEFAENHPELVKLGVAFAAVAGAVVVVGTALTGIIGAVGTISAGFTALSGGLGAMGVTLSGVLLPVLGVIAALAAIGYVLYSNWETISQVAQTVSDKISFAWEQLMTRLQPAFDMISNAVSRVASNFGFLQGNGDLASAMFNTLGSVITAVATVAMTVFEVFVNAVAIYLNMFVEVGSNVIDFVANVFTGQWGAAWENVKAIFTAIWDGITGLFDSFISSISNGIDALMGKASNIPVIGGAVAVAQNATGGIYSKGPFLTTFAEEGPEAAIPLDGSPNAKNLWYQAGEMLGMFNNSNPATSGTTNNTEYSKNEAINISIPVTINGNADVNTVDSMQAQIADIVKKAISDLSNYERRVSFV